MTVVTQNEVLAWLVENKQVERITRLRLNADGSVEVELNGVSGPAMIMPPELQRRVAEFRRTGRWYEEQGDEE